MVNPSLEKVCRLWLTSSGIILATEAEHFHPVWLVSLWWTLTVSSVYFIVWLDWFFIGVIHQQNTESGWAATESQVLTRSVYAIYNL